MKVSKWQSAKISYYIDAEIASADGNTVFITLALTDETAPWGNTTHLSFHSRIRGGDAVWMQIHADPASCAALRQFAGNARSTPADAGRLLGMIAADAAPRGDLNASQQEAWDGFIAALGFSIVLY